MLIIISDLHLGDGTCGKRVTPATFQIFVDRLTEMAARNSRYLDGGYRHINCIDILLLGDILDPLHSTSWLAGTTSDPGYVRPWTDFKDPPFVEKLGGITQAILNHNRESIAILKELTQTGLTLPLDMGRERRGRAVDTNPVRVNLHYMVGNHDWYYHLPGKMFDQIRSGIVEAFGLSNGLEPFPHTLGESEELKGLLGEYQVHAQHGDMYDPFNYNIKNGRDASSLGDAFAVEILNRFPMEVKARMGDALPKTIIENLRELFNVRPALATPLWISSQLRQNEIPHALQKKLKGIWNEMTHDFLGSAFVQAQDKPLKLDAVDGLETAVRITDLLSFDTLDRLSVWLRRIFGSEQVTFARFALKEAAFLHRQAQFIVYGHTHRHEVVPLDSFPGIPRPTNQMYMNSGTWHTYHDLAINKPEEQKFIPYQVLTYLTFFKEDERQGRRFETWSGSFSD